MEGYRLIDEQTVSKLRITPEEVNAVAELWAVQNRLGHPGGPMIHQVPSGLVIPQAEVKNYLREIRGATARRFRPARSLGADVRLAFLAAMVLVVAAFGLNAMFASRRQSQMYPYYPPIYESVDAAPNGWVRTTPGSPFADEYLMRRSMRPDRLVMSSGSRLVEPQNYMERPSANRVGDMIRAAVGGPLAQKTSLSPDSISADRAQKAIAAHGSNTPTSDANLLLEWKKLRVAFGGKITAADVPYARFTDKHLVDAVAAEQAKVIAALLEATLHLTNQSPARRGEDAPSPAPSP